MIPRTFPSTYASNGQQQMVVYFLPSIAGLQRWLDYIPVKLAQGGSENSYDNDGYIDVTVVSYPTATQQAWKEYIPVYLDDAAIDAWQVNARGYIPYGYALFGDASMIMDMTNTGALDPRVTFSRTSNATLFDSAGNLVYAPHNLLVQSESFDSSAFTKVNATISANTTTAPDSSTTADKLIEDTATGEHSASQQFAFAAGVQYTASVYVKAAERTLCRFGAGNTGVWAAGVVADLSSGVITSTLAGSGSIVAVGNGWYRLSVTGTAATTASTGVSVRLVSTGATISYTGDGVSGLFIWGAQLNISTLQPYYPTTVKNLLGYTQEFDNAAWTKTRSSITANATTAPDGSVTADKFVIDTTAATNHPVGQNQSVLSGTTYTLSAYAKAGEITQINLRFSAQFPAGSTFFDLSAGTKTNVGTVVDSTISPVGDGWYRCSITQTANASGTAQAQVFLAAAGAIAIATANGTDGVFLWGAQLSDSASLDPYVYNPVAAPTSVAYYGPRFDYDPVTLAARGLLVEEQRTNSIRNSVGVGAVVGTPGTLPTNWSGATAGSGITREITGIGVEGGISYIDLKLSGTASALYVAFLQFEPSSGIAAATGQSWSASFYAKLQSGSLSGVDSVALRIDELDAAGVLLASTTTTLIPTSAALGAQRATVSRAFSNASTAFVRSALRLQINSGSTADITLRIGLPQLELGAFATSVIPTTTAAATRTADVATMIGDNFANWYNATTGTVFSEYSAVVSGTRTVVGINDGTANESIRLRTVSADPKFTVTDGGVDQADIDAGTVASNTVYKFVGAYAADDFAASIAGGAVGTDTSGTLPTVNRMMLGGSAAANYLNGHLRRVAYYPRKLSDSELRSVSS